MADKLVLAIDFNNILFGSYYGAPLINSKGMNVNAIKGFFFKLRSLKETFNPDYIVMANDLSRERTFRRKMYPPYKAQRKAHDDDIIMQLKYAQQIAALLGYKFINNELYEADDVLGMISNFLGERETDVIIASSDRDLYQLIDDHTFIMAPKHNELIDERWLFDNYQMTPQQWIELKMLQGDRSDNIPGIPGVGEKTALTLMQQYGSINEIYNHISELKPGLQKKLEDGKKVLPLTRDLVTIIRDYRKIGLTEDMMLQGEPFLNEVYDLIEKLEIYSLVNVIEFSLMGGN
ncbi:MAG: hypothetical protein NC548_12770 [Lachnospiraceae bacterium]|nr:hypothetical protein [Lachnospiraceae bacterium]MCM1230737.1 hypothetical protein [Ruminococcus flavefaciens]